MDWISPAIVGTVGGLVPEGNVMKPEMGGRFRSKPTSAYDVFYVAAIRLIPPDWDRRSAEATYGLI